MMWHHVVPLFFGGVILTNAAPHWVSGVMGKPFQTPFAKPPGQGLSSSTVNVLWGFFNLVIGYGLVFRLGDVGSGSTGGIVALALGVLLMSLVHARIFGRFHGGNAPDGL